MNCPKCGKENLEDARFCASCGAGLSEGVGPGAGELKTRGGCLTIWLILMMLFSAIGAYGYLRFVEFMEYPISPAVQILLVGLSIAQIVCAIAIWMWKKWGVYACIANGVAVIVINTMIHVPIMQSLLGFAVGVTILVLLVRKRWEWFG